MRDLNGYFEKKRTNPTTAMILIAQSDNWKTWWLFANWCLHSNGESYDSRELL